MQEEDRGPLYKVRVSSLEAPAARPVPPLLCPVAAVAAACLLGQVAGGRAVTAAAAGAQRPPRPFSTGSTGAHLNAHCSTACASAFTAYAKGASVLTPRTQAGTGRHRERLRRRNSALIIHLLLPMPLGLRGDAGLR